MSPLSCRVAGSLNSSTFADACTGLSSPVLSSAAGAASLLEEGAVPDSAGGLTAATAAAVSELGERDMLSRRTEGGASASDIPGVCAKDLDAVDLSKLLKEVIDELLHSACSPCLSICKMPS